MSRPIKQGLDYFPLDVDCDDKIELIEAKHGISGFGIVIKLFQKIYKEGYFLNWNQETLLLFSKRVNVDNNTVSAIIKDCFAYNIFNESINKEFNVLTSSGIQKRYLNAIDRRKEIILDKRFVIVDINGINANIIWINEDISTQSKVKESIVKKKIIYSEFYDSEIERSEQDQSYIKVVKILFGENNLNIPLKSVLKMEIQLSFCQFKKLWYLKEKYKISITEILEQMENWKELKNRKTIYSTFLTFAKKRNPNIELK